GRDPRGGLRRAAAAARRRGRDHHHHPVPAALAAPPPGGALGEAGGVRRDGRRGQGDRLRRGDERTVGAFVVPGRSAVPSGLRVPYGHRRRRWARPRPPLTAPTSEHPREAPSMAGDKKSDPKAVRREAEAKQQAARKAEKERKRNSTDPKDMGRVKQVVHAYKLTKEQDPILPWLLLAAFLLPLVAGVVVGIVLRQWLTAPLFGLMVGLVLAMVVLVQRAKRATFKRYAGQAGSAEVALSDRKS